MTFSIAGICVSNTTINITIFQHEIVPCLKQNLFLYLCIFHPVSFSNSIIMYNFLSFRMVAEAHKYWFHMYNVVHSHLTGESNSDSVTTVLQNFIEKSNLAEYEVRLNLIYIYHCHLVHVERSGKRGMLF